MSHHSGEEQGKFIILRTIWIPTPLKKVPIEIVFHPFTIFLFSWTGKRQDAHGRMAQKCFPLIKTPPPRKRNDVFKRRTLNMTVYVNWKGHFSDLSYLHVIFSHYI